MGLKSRIATGLIGAICAICVPVIGYYEGYVPNTYADPVGIPTVCFGHTGPKAAPDASYTLDECKAMLDGDARRTLDRLMQCIDAKLPAHEWAALTSLAYNVGAPAVCHSTIARMIRAGSPASAWCEQFDRWVYAGGRKLPGLVKRRAGEKLICLGLAHG